MTGSSSAATRLLSRISEHVLESVDIELFLFGSSTQDKEFPSDVDVLLIYPDGNLSGGHKAAEAIRELRTAETYDVLALSQSEEHELEFIDGECAVKIWP